MPDPRQLPFLLRLIDDDSPTVREVVARELASFGDAIEEELARQRIEPGESQQRILRGIFADRCRARLRAAWGRWQSLEEDLDRLEEALTLLSEFQNGPAYPRKLPDLLDRLAAAFSASHGRKDVFSLSDYLFKELRLSGEQADYYNPANSNLVYVIEKRRGIPISLSCAMILVGRRAGIAVEGCSFPGHFLTRAWVDGERVFIDCFSGGRCLEEKELETMGGGGEEEIRRILHAPVHSAAIVARVLRNLAGAYARANEREDANLMLELLKGMAP